MKSKQIMWFLTFNDIKDILKEIEAVFELQYYQAGMFQTALIPNYKSIFDTDYPGQTFFGDWNRVDRYLVMDAKSSLNIREVCQKKGGVNFAVDQELNPKSIELKLGGIYLESENVIVAGRVSTISANEFSENLYKIFMKKIKTRFKKIGNFYVGEEAEAKLRSGWRLVTNCNLPYEYDLALD